MKFKTLSLLLIMLCNYTLAQSDYIFKAGFEFVSRLNDTGITWAGEYYSGNNADCSSSTITSPQDCNVGRDATHNNDSEGHAGFSFTKLDVNGNPLADQSVDYATNPWACVRDNVTGLVWEVKTTTAGIHNKDNTYKWGGITAIGLGHPNAEGTYYSDWDELVNGSNAGNGLCGFTDWRVPKVGELSGLANQGAFNPSIDTNYFPNTESSWFWTSSPIAGIDGDAWVVGFYYGSVYYINRDFSGRVRLVRSLGQ